MTRKVAGQADTAILQRRPDYGADIQQRGRESTEKNAGVRLLGYTQQVLGSMPGDRHAGLVEAAEKSWEFQVRDEL